ncbi:MAG: fumarylacetoacetate hydrolase family protein [Candidatus Omnitrophica bacterium]|jgi:2-keto-4-pentenoate hydratase/2-oxohepta-3-ene-1,7-dioic acid hydratase in catechol pathway|nr:fumarylacetoacetate hydrolase family protein [Candidatus Omnitrophota bacterium]
MRLIHFSHNRKEYWGILEEKNIRIIREEPSRGIKPVSKKIPVDCVKFLPPAKPTKIVLIGLNYKDHARELNMALPKEPLIFLKPSTSLIGHNDAITYPSSVRQLDYEAELAIVIKKEGKNIKPKDVRKYILGFTCLNDVTARDLQRRDGQWTRAKSFDTFCPLGPWLETGVSPKDLRIRSYLNGKLRQDSNTSEFIFPYDYLVSFISKIMTLNPGDVISTGTPSGIGAMERGDTIEIEIEGIAKLVNYIK